MGSKKLLQKVKMNGKIELIAGPMFAGKSSELLRQVKRYRHAKKKCLLVNYIEDTRYTDDDCITTHDLEQLKAMKVMKLEELKEIYKKYDVIAIDEGQFFSDIDIYSEVFANDGKIVLIAALDSTFQRKGFGKICNLIPLCEQITKLTSICVYCYEAASFTKRIVESNEVELIGGAEMYRPVCRKCFFEYQQMSQKSSPEKLYADNQFQEIQDQKKLQTAVNETKKL
eukprot:TRINITY_DN11212_c0_g1_i2.p1 TRINITY_DN11212_c0_g1~~TRINITY_DN11212_c0_g1_i2.p1  ORF type:complete len:227 (+),score=39.48 TRINITY_DN11212_c0_g1_i2:209-889(+)